MLSDCGFNDCMYIYIHAMISVEKVQVCVLLAVLAVATVGGGVGVV